MIYEAISASILANAVYDIMKNSLVISGENLKTRLQGWLIDDSTLTALQEQICSLELNEYMSESAIEKRLLESDDLLRMIEKIKPNRTTTIVQTHSGTGDNVAGNKITYTK